jgi:hypothetical protein
LNIYTQAWTLAALIGLVKTVLTTYAAGEPEPALDLGLCGLADNHRAPLKKTESQRRLVDRNAVGMLWQSVWETLVRRIAHYNSGSVELALALMKEILDHDLVDAKLVRESQGELWKASLFNEPSKCGIAGIEFVISFLRRHEIKDTAVEWGGAEVARGLKKRRYGDSSSSDLSSASKDSNGQITQRERLVEWLLLSLNRDTINVRLSKNMLKPISPYLISTAVVALIRPGPPPTIRAATSSSSSSSSSEEATERAKSTTSESDPYRRSIASASLNFSTPSNNHHSSSSYFFAGIEEYTGKA